MMSARNRRRVGNASAMADDAELAARRAAMDERMAAREREAEARRAAKADDAESSGAAQIRDFEASFRAQQTALSAALDAVADAGALDGCAAQVAGLHELVASASSFLPVAIRETSSGAVRDLEARLKAERERLAPRKKFAFRNRAKMGAAPAGAPAGAPPTAAVGSGGGPGADAPSKHVDAFAASAAACAGLRERADATLVRPAGEESGADFALADLTRCEVSLLSSSTALWMRGLRGCVVKAVPVAGAIYISDCEQTTFVLAGRQIRIHTSNRCDVYVHAASHPILEHCREFRFAPYPPLPPKLEGALAAAALRADVNMWDQVDDFDWLKAQQSPHWSVVPEDERKTYVIGE